MKPGYAREKKMPEYRIQARLDASGLVLGLVGLAALVCFACGEEKKPPAPPPPKEKATQTAQAASPAGGDESKPVVASTYIYSSVGKRDPFRSEYKLIKKKGKEVEGGILTRYEIDQLKLTSIITGIPNPRAQVELPDGKGVTIRVGTRVGKNYGRVVSIRGDEVVVAEEYRDWTRKKKTNYLKMKLIGEKIE